MRRENRKSKDEDKIKWGKLVSFFIAIILLGVAIAMSMVQEKTVGSLDYNKGENNKVNNNWIEQASSSISKNINEVEKENITNNNLNENESKENVIKNETINPSNTANNNVNETKTNVENNNNDKKEEAKQNEVQENNKTKEENNTVNFIFPVEGDVIKEYAKDNLIYSETLEEWITHSGIDIKADRAAIVKATADGTVKSIKNDPRYGLTVTIEHNDGYVSSYSSLLTAEFVKEGEKVTRGTNYRYGW